MGPVAHSHEFDLPKKVKALGLRHALSSKAKAGSIVVLDEAKSQGHQDRRAGQAVRQAGRRPARWWWMASSTRTSSCRPATSADVVAAAGRRHQCLRHHAQRQAGADHGRRSKRSRRALAWSGHDQLRRHPLAGDHGKGDAPDRSQPGRVPRHPGRHQAGHRQGGRRPVQGQGEGGQHGASSRASASSPAASATRAAISRKRS